MSRRLASTAPVVVLVVVLVAATMLSRPAVAVRAPGPAPGPAGVWPLSPVPVVLAGFDPPDQPWAAGHRGVDLAGTAGQSVRAALAGTVRYAGRLAGRGVVVVDHGATRTTYEPVAATVVVGTPVAAGQRIGILEVAGGHCLPRACLHWGWLRGEVYLDPLDLVGAAPVRLLPLWRDRPAPAAVTDAKTPGAVPPLAWPAPLPFAPWLPLLRLLHHRWST